MSQKALNNRLYEAKPLEDPCQMFMTGRIIRAWGLSGDSEAVSCGLIRHSNIVVNEGFGELLREVEK